MFQINYIAKIKDHSIQKTYTVVIWKSINEEKLLLSKSTIPKQFQYLHVRECTKLSFFTYDKRQKQRARDTYQKLPFTACRGFKRGSFFFFEHPMTIYRYYRKRSLWNSDLNPSDRKHSIILWYTVDVDAIARVGQLTLLMTTWKFKGEWTLSKRNAEDLLYLSELGII